MDRRDLQSARPSPGIRADPRTMDPGLTSPSRAAIAPQCFHSSEFLVFREFVRPIWQTRLWTPAGKRNETNFSTFLVSLNGLALVNFQNGCIHYKPIQVKTLATHCDSKKPISF